MGSYLFSVLYLLTFHYWVLPSTGTSQVLLGKWLASQQYLLCRPLVCLNAGKSVTAVAPFLFSLTLQISTLFIFLLLFYKRLRKEIGANLNDQSPFYITG